MGAPTNLVESYTSIGIKEDVSDLIHNISPTETPFLSSMGTTSAGQRVHQWQDDVLAAPDGDNAAIEGGDASLEQRDPTSMNSNYTVIQDKVFGVSGSVEVFEKYGRDSQMAYEAAKAARELKTDCDAAMTAVNQGPVVGNTVDTARRTASFETWLRTNLNIAGDATAPTFSNTFPVAGSDGTARAFAQSQLDAVIQSAWTNGGKPSIILAGPVQKTNLSGFDGVGSIGSKAAAETIVRSDAASRTIFATADVYVSNFGELKVVPSRHIRQATGVDVNVFVYDPEYVKIAYARPWQQYDLAKNGDSIRRQMLVEWALEVCNERAHGRVGDLN